MRISRLLFTSFLCLGASAHGFEVSDERLVSIVSSDDVQALQEAIGKDYIGMQRVVGFDQEERADLLSVAAFRGSSRVVSALLGAGADVDGEPAISNGANIKRHTPLYLASARGQSTVVAMLLTAGANKELADSAGYGPVHVASAFGRQEVVQLLLNAGVPVDRRSSRGDTALKLAVMRRQLAIAKLLLQGGANPHLADRRGDTPLHEAVRNDDAAMVALLLANHAVLSRNRYNLTPLDEASYWAPELTATLSASSSHTR